MKSFNVLIFMLTLLWGNASASYDACLKIAGGATMDVVRCMDREYERLETVIRKRLERLRRCLPLERHAEIETLYRSWGDYSQSKCGLYVGASGGTGDKEDAGECLIDSADDFADELKEFIEIYCGK